MSHNAGYNLLHARSSVDGSILALKCDNNGGLKKTKTKTNNGLISLGSSDAVPFYADTNPIPTQDTNTRQGWLFTQATALQKFNYYFYSQGNTAIQVKDLTNVNAVVSVDKYTAITNIPFFVVYTKPTGVNDFGSFYHSKFVYTLTNNEIIDLGEFVNMYSIKKHEAHNSYRHVDFTTLTSSGDALTTEEILTIAIHSDSGGTNTKILVKEVGYDYLKNGKVISKKLKLDI